MHIPASTLIRLFLAHVLSRLEPRVSWVAGAGGAQASRVGAHVLPVHGHERVREARRVHLRHVPWRSELWSES